jgi:hypothetical protein
MYPRGYLTLTLTKIPRGVFQGSGSPGGTASHGARVPGGHQGIRGFRTPEESRSVTYDRTVRRETAGVEAAAASVGEALADRGWASSPGPA